MSRGNDSCAALAWKIESVILKSGLVPPDCAPTLMREIMDGLHDDFGGGDIYIARLDRAARDAGIRRDFNGANVRALMQKYRVSRPTVYRVLSAGQ